jgi:hypothetical protein
VFWMVKKKLRMNIFNGMMKGYKMGCSMYFS